MHKLIISGTVAVKIKLTFGQRATNMQRWQP